MRNTAEQSQAAAYVKMKLDRAEKTLATNRRGFNLAIETRNAGMAKKFNREIQSGERRLKLLQSYLARTPMLPYEIR